MTSGSAADQAGLQAGDVITKVDDTAITSPDDLAAAVNGHQPGDKVTVTYHAGRRHQDGEGDPRVVARPAAIDGEVRRP